MLDDLIDFLGDLLDFDGEGCDLDIDGADTGANDVSDAIPLESNSNNLDNIENTSEHNIAFQSKLPPNHSTDGYIFQGGENYKGFDVYKKFGHKYYWDCYKNIFVEIK